MLVVSCVDVGEKANTNATHTKAKMDKNGRTKVRSNNKPGTQ